MVLVTTRATQREARYTPEGGIERCAYCRHFVSQGTCNRIIGPVSPRGWCKYFSQQITHTVLDPGGFVPTGAPAVNLDFTTGTLDPSVTFARASTGTYINNAGLVQAAAVNAPRLGYDPVTLAARGMLIEEARTNLILQSSNLANAAWTKFSVTVAAPTVTANAATAPDGTLTAASVVFPAVSVGGTASSVYQNLTVTAAAYTFSIWLRGSVGGERLYLSSTLDTSTWYRTSCTLTTSWQRFTLTTSNLTAAGWFFFVGTDLRDAGQGAAPAQTIYAWGGQVELGANLTSYIPTTSAAVNRAADLATVAASSSGPATMVVDALWAVVPPANTFLADFNDGTAANRTALFNQAAIDAYGGVASVQQWQTSIGGATIGVPFKAGQAWAAGTQAGCLNGGAVVSLGTGSIPTGLTRVNLGANNASALLMDGYIRRFRYWPRALSNTELQQVTT